MIDTIQNGVTAGGVAPLIVQPTNTVDLYRQYLEQAQQARQKALENNYSLIKDLDVSKVDQRDRFAIQSEYEKLRDKALSPPPTTRKGDYNKWRSEIFRGYTDLQKKISDIVDYRKNLVETVSRNRDRYDYDGLNQANQWLDAPVVDKDGGFIKYDFNTLGVKPEHVYDVDGAIQKFIGQNTIKSQQLAQSHRSHDGKTVSVDADVLNLGALNQNIKDELNSNPEFKYAVDKSYKNFLASNPGTNVTLDSFLQGMVDHHLPARSKRDAEYVKSVIPGENLYAYNYSVKDPNNYVQHININAQNAAAEKAMARENQYQNFMGSIARGLASNDKNDMLTGSQQASQLLKGLKYGDMGTINGVHIETDGNGKKVLSILTTNDEYGIPRRTKIPADDPKLYRKLHDIFNARYQRQPQYMITDKSYNEFLNNKGSIDKDYSGGGESTAPTQPGKQKVDLKSLGKRIKTALGGLGSLGKK